jgi:hypothetical protein
MRYPGDADGGAVPGGQERSPGRPGPPWPRAADSDQPDRSENLAGRISGHNRLETGPADTGFPDTGFPDTGRAGGEMPGSEYLGGWPADAEDGSSGGDYTGSWYSDGGYSDAGYGYGDGAYGGGRRPGPEPAAGFVAADLMAADVTTASGQAPAGSTADTGTAPADMTAHAGPSPADATAAAGPSAADAMAADRVLAGGVAEPGGIPSGSALYGAAGGTAGKGPVRGFPPAPGQPAPVYPPGQFAAWNQPPAEARDGRVGGSTLPEAWPGAASAEHGYAEPAYSVLAVSDPAADATATQTWAVADDQPAGSWRDMQARAGQATGTDQSPAGRRPGTGNTRPLPGRPAASTSGSKPERGARGPARGRRARKTARAKRFRVLLAAGLAMVIAAGAGTFFYLAGGRPQASHPAGAPGTTPAATQPGQPSPSPSPTGRWGHIQTRLTDPQKLTLHQLFPVRFSSSGSAYTRTAAKAGKHCSSAVIGSRLQSAVSAAGCSQVMRASYLAGNRKMMGTIGVLNLKGARVASRAGTAAGPSQFIAQLRGAKGPTRRLNKGTGIEEAEVKGHYLILIWAEFASLHAPKHHAQKKELVQFSTHLLKNTANVSLSRRLVTGKP